jgi:hypothetical protein
MTTHRIGLTDAERQAINDAVAALPPLTDQQLDALTEVIIASRERRRRRWQAHQPPPAQAA